uniref:Uncharacterized protein n=1 Tax=Peronospora matthiolae TaxID=2874970 RepID=A0AAV1SZN4_9STRA
MTASRSQCVSACKSVHGLAGVVELLQLRRGDKGNGGSRMASMVVCTVCAVSVGYSAVGAVTQAVGCMPLRK